MLLAVSGGVDSMALLGAAAAWPGVEVASLDHGVRAGAPGEVALVRAEAARLGLPFHTERLEVAPGAGFEQAARRARYGALRAIAASRKLAFIATAHTATDQAETVLMRLARGSALAGARGILRRRDDGVVRPLLFATRADTSRFVHDAGLAFAVDPMNADPSYLRVRVRQRALPALVEAAGPRATQALARFAELAAEDEAWLNAEAKVALGRCHVPAGLDALAVNALPPPIRRRVLARWFEAQGVPLDAHHLHDAVVAIARRRTATLPSDRVLRVVKGVVGISAAPARLHGTSSSEDGRDPGE